MLTVEAKWLHQTLNNLPIPELHPLLSIGSGDCHARTEKQPWIEREVFIPLEHRGVRVLHHELRPGPGVDIAGDLLDHEFRSSLASLAPHAILCANVLEHLPDRRTVIEAFIGTLLPGGLLLVTVPRVFPYHPDPIDTMFRPSVSELAEELMPFELVKGDIVRCESLLGYLLRSPDKVASIRNGLRSLTGPKAQVHEQTGHRSLGHWDQLRHLTTATEVTCCVFRSPS